MIYEEVSIVSSDELRDLWGTYNARALGWRKREGGRGCGELLSLRDALGTSVVTNLNNITCWLQARFP